MAKLIEAHEITFKGPLNQSLPQRDKVILNPAMMKVQTIREKSYSLSRFPAQFVSSFGLEQGEDLLFCQVQLASGAAILLQGSLKEVTELLSD